VIDTPRMRARMSDKPDEAVLNAHDQIVQSAVVGRPVDGNEEIVAFVQL
jgi:acyl-coenzyme A synthetase/AMP-(fatty) acid ligase